MAKLKIKRAVSFVMATVLSLGKDFSKLQIAFTSNLGTNAGVMAANDWAIRYPSKVLQSIGGRIFLYSEEFLLKSQQVL